MAERPFPLEFATLIVDTRPRRCLALPAGFVSSATSDLESPVFDTTPQALLEAFMAAALAEPRTDRVRESEGQIELVQRSALFKFPDYVTASAVSVEGGAALCVYSRAVIGYSDIGVNTKRVKRWLEATRSQVQADQAVGRAK